MSTRRRKSRNTFRLSSSVVCSVAASPLRRNCVRGTGVYGTGVCAPIGNAKAAPAFRRIASHPILCGAKTNLTHADEKPGAQHARAAYFVLLAFLRDKEGRDHMGKTIGSSFSLRRAPAVDLGEIARIISGVAAAVMFSGSVYSSSGTGSVGSNELGYHDYDSARAFSAVSAIRIPLQNSDADPGGIAMTPKYRSTQTDLSGDSIIVLPGARIDLKNNQVTEDRSQEDRSLIRVIKDGWRAVTGFIRGNPDYPTSPTAATIGVRGSAGKMGECNKGPQCMWQSMLHWR